MLKIGDLIFVNASSYSNKCIAVITNIEYDIYGEEYSHKISVFSIFEVDSTTERIKTQFYFDHNRADIRDIRQVDESYYKKII